MNGLKAHDSRVLHNSTLYEVSTTNPNRLYGNGGFLIADNGYPCLPWCIVPYRQTPNMQPSKVEFNRRLSSGRVAIEQAFGLLKCKWRRLSFVPFRTMRRTVYLVRACCILHNLGLMLKGDQYDRMDPEDMEYLAALVVNEQNEIEGEFEEANEENVQTGAAKRDLLRFNH